MDSYFRKTLLALGDMILFLTGLLSLLLIFLWIFPEHHIFANNTDLLWANPLVLLLFFLRRKTGNWLVRWIIRITLALAILGLLSTWIVERNNDLASLAALITIQLYTLLHRKPQEMLRVA